MSESSISSRSKVQFLRVEELQQGQRLDNFLFKTLKGVPRSRIYRFIRRGEVRINKKRCKPEYKLQKGDTVRIPPYEEADLTQPPAPSENLIRLIKQSILLEDEAALIVNKPAGLAVHGGSGIRLGLIEAIRQADPRWHSAELAHRLDKGTSGCLVISKNLNYLRGLQEQLKKKDVDKRYQALVYGKWPEKTVEVDAPLAKNLLSSGERMVRVDPAGKRSVTGFQVLRSLPGATLLEARPRTGRTHQIRVHCQYAGHSIVGDGKYLAGEKASAAALRNYKQLCLHAASIQYVSPLSGEVVSAAAELPEHIKALLQSLA